MHQIHLLCISSELLSVPLNPLNTFQVKHIQFAGDVLKTHCCLFFRCSCLLQVPENNLISPSPCLLLCLPPSRGQGVLLGGRCSDAPSQCLHTSNQCCWTATLSKMRICSLCAGRGEAGHGQSPLQVCNTHLADFTRFSLLLSEMARDLDFTAVLPFLF